MAKYSSNYMRGSASDLLSRSSNKQVNRLYYSKNNEYRYANGKILPSGIPIRQLNDGTIMSGHRHTKSSQILVPIKTQPIRKQLGIDKRGRSIVSNQKPANVVARKRTLTNNELDYEQ